MNIKLGSSEDFTINTKSNYVLTFPNATGTIALTSDLTSKESSSNKVTAWSSTTTDAHYPSEKLVKTSLDGKLDKTTWEWNKQLSNGSNGKVCIGKFFMYDSNVTIDLSFTSTNTYNATVVLTSANLNRAASPGRIQVDVYGDIPNTITPLLSVFRPNEYSTGSVEIYADLPAWSKCFVHIQGILDGANNATEGGNSYPESAYDILTSVTSIPTAVTGKTLLTNDGTSQNGRVCNLMKKDYYSKVANGTSSQFLKADGSVDSNAYTTHGIPTGGSAGQMLVKSSATNYAVEWSNPVKEVTWSELKTLRDNSNLIPGQKYRITDYVATTTQTDTQSANHPFDIIVQALSTNKLAEEAKAVQHSGDSYFNSCKLSKWKVWYTIDNVWNQYTWADTTNGKGVIYRLIDEYGNDLPYDFKGIQFKRYKVSTANYTPFSPLVGLYIGLSTTQGLAIDSTDYKWYYTFSEMGSTWDADATDASIHAGFTTDVVFTTNKKTDFNNHVNSLLNNVFAYGPIVHDFLNTQSGGSGTYSVGTMFTNMRFDGSDCINNTVIGWGGLVITQSTFRRNLIVGSFRHLEFGTNYQDNSIFNTTDFAFCRWGHGCDQNKIFCTSISDTDFGSYWRQNSFACSTIQNSGFSNYFVRNTGTDLSFGSVYINGGQFNDCTFSGKFLSCTFDAICSYCDIVGGTNGDKVTGVDVIGNIRGTSSAHINIEGSDFVYADSNKSTKRRIRIEGQDNGNMIISWYSADKLIRKTKGASGSTWTTLSEYESTGNKVTSLSSSSTTTQYASAKTTYDEIHPTVGTSIPSGGMKPNVFYNLGTITAGTTMSFATGATGIYNEYQFQFAVGSTVPTITWDNSITKWMGGSSAPTLQANTSYEVSVVNGLAVIVSF